MFISSYTFLVHNIFQIWNITASYLSIYYINNTAVSKYILICLISCQPLGILKFFLYVDTLLLQMTLSTVFTFWDIIFLG